MEIIVHGATGRMGQKLLSLMETTPGCTLAAAVSPELTTCPEKREFYALPEYQGAADVIIDFSFHGAVGALLDYAKARKLPVVICTTGHTPEERAAIDEASREIPVFYSGNMSVGVALLVNLAKEAAKTLPDAEVEIVEIHHDQKIDAPSGTALMLADAAASALPYSPEYVYDRHSVRKPRENREIGIASVRGGTITGDHTVIFTGPDEIIEISHHAASRDVFAAGAVRAAKFLSGVTQPGLYDMSHLL